jgi:hypothetical protein
MPGPDPHGTGLKSMSCPWCMALFDARMTHAETCCAKVQGAARHNAFQEVVMSVVHVLGGFARATGLSIEIPPHAVEMFRCVQVECKKTRCLRVDVEFGGLAEDGITQWMWEMSRFARREQNFREFKIQIGSMLQDRLFERKTQRQHGTSNCAMSSVCERSFR